MLRPFFLHWLASQHFLRFGPNKQSLAMQLSSTSSPRRRWSAAFIGAAAALLFAGTASAQVAFSQNFDVNSTGWTGTITRYTGATTCGGVGGAMRKNVYSGTTNGTLVSPSVGTSLGGTMTITYDYKIAVWSANTVGAATPWGTIDVQYGATATGPWTTFASITDEAQTGSCLAKSHMFTPPAGALFIRWSTTWTGGDNYWNVDNVTVTESLAPCAGTPTPIVSAIAISR